MKVKYFLYATSHMAKKCISTHLENEDKYWDISTLQVIQNKFQAHTFSSSEEAHFNNFISIKIQF